jgi:hypothetical protein
MISDVQALAGEIGPRGTGTPGEAAAADHVARRIELLGLKAERHSFQAVASQNAFPLGICLVALGAVALYPLGGAAGRWLAALLALSAAPMLWQTIRTSSNPLRFLLPQVASGNVLAWIPSRDEVKRRVVILAHLDTNRCRLIWQSATRRSLEPLTYLTLAMLALPGILYLAGAWLAAPGGTLFEADGPWLASLIPAAYMIGMIVTLLRDDRAEFSPGAHDNAASVAVALEVGARLAARPLQGTQVWLAFTGAEETDHAGLYELLRRYDSSLQGAAFIGLEGLGSGQLAYLTRQGLCAHYRPDESLLSQVAAAAARYPELGARPAEMLGEDETGTLRRFGYRAICIAGRDPISGTLPYWHQPEDTVDKVSTEFMSRAAGFVMAILEELDNNGPRSAPVRKY